MTSCCCRALEWHMPLFAPALRFLPRWWCSCCCAFRPLIHHVAMFRGLCGQSFGGRDSVVASRCSRCRRGLAHLKEGAQRGSAWFLLQNRDCQFQGSRECGAQARRCCHAPIAISWRRLRSKRKRQAVSAWLQWVSCVQWMCNDCTWSRREMLGANCDSRSWGNGRRNCQAANGASKKRVADRQQGAR